VRIQAGEPGTGAGCYILFNGQPIQGCVIADEEGGFVEVHRCSASGRPVMENGHIVHERWHGRVEIAFTLTAWLERRHLHPVTA
jgi:hypothetical protein